MYVSLVCVSYYCVHGLCVCVGMHVCEGMCVGGVHDLLYWLGMVDWWGAWPSGAICDLLADPWLPSMVHGLLHSMVHVLMQGFEIYFLPGCMAYYWQSAWSTGILHGLLLEHIALRVVWLLA